MTDKVRKIRKEVEKLRSKNTEAFDCGCDGTKCAGYDMACDNILSFIDSTQEEPVSEDLEEAAKRYSNNEEPICTCEECLLKSFKTGAKWQKENLWKPADGDDLPPIDKEVVALVGIKDPTATDCICGYKVVFAHRPASEGYDGRSLTTGEVEHYTPKTYGEGGWNIPDVKWWLDIELPKEIEL